MEQAISAKIVTLVANGMSVQQAYDVVFGEGSYAAFAGMIYDELRANV